MQSEELHNESEYKKTCSLVHH